MFGPHAAGSIIVHTIHAGRFLFDCTVSLTAVCGQQKESAVMVFILSKLKCFFRLLQSAALQSICNRKVPVPPIWSCMIGLNCPMHSYRTNSTIFCNSFFIYHSSLSCNSSFFSISSTFALSFTHKYAITTFSEFPSIRPVSIM